jgi:N4-gp56 family major capsid protein
MSVLNTAAAQGATFHNVLGAVRDVYSAEIYLSALPVMKFEQFTTKKSELGVQPGLTIQLPKFSNIKRGGRLREGKRIPIQPMNQTQQPIRVVEYGNGIGFSELLLQSSFYDQMAAASLLLGRDMSVVLDTELRDVIMGAPNVIFPNGKAARTALVAADVFDTDLIKDGVETLEANNAPKWGNDHWICFCHPHQGRKLRDDTNWINAAMYSGLGQVYTGEMGRYEDTRFIVSTILPNGRNSAVDPLTGDPEDIGFDETLEAGFAGNAVDIYRAVMFGEYSLGHAVALPVELRDNNNQDFGREHGLAWYSIFGQSVLEAKNVVVMETA